MNINTTCPSCSHRSQVADEHIGVEIACSNCSYLFIVRKPLPPPMARRIQFAPRKYGMDSATARRIVEEKKASQLAADIQKEDRIDKAIDTLCNEARTQYRRKNALEDFTLALQQFEEAYKQLDRLTDVVDERNKKGRRPVAISNGYEDLLLAWNEFFVNKLNPSVNSFYTADFLDRIVDLNGEIIVAFSKMHSAFHSLSNSTQNKILAAYTTTLDLVNENLELLKVALTTSEQDVKVWGSQINRLKDIKATLKDQNKIAFLDISLLKYQAEIILLHSCVEKAKHTLISYIVVLKKTLT